MLHSDEVGGAGDEDLAAAAAVFGLRSMEQQPPAVEPVREQRRVLVVGAPDDPVPLDGDEVLGEREVDGRPRRAVRGAGDHPAVELVDPDDAGILETPLLARDAGAGGEERLGIDRPAVDSVRGAGDGEVRDPTQVFDPGEQHGLVLERGGGRVEDGVRRIGPLLRAEDRIAGMALEELPHRCGGRDASCRRLLEGVVRIGARTPGGVEQQSRAMERERRLGALVAVQRLAAEAVAAAAGREVVERQVEAVASEKPLERAPRANAVLGLVRDGERHELRLDEGGSVERLLVAVTGGGLARGGVRRDPGRRRKSSCEAALVAEPPQRLEAELDQVVAPERGRSSQERLRQARVVVAQIVLEPAASRPPAVVR